jgi:NitT/TauT family transport system substrate-binding protein
MRRRNFLIAATATFAAPSLRAQTPPLRLAYQPGTSYLPLVMAQRMNLIEKHAAALGARGLATEWTKFGSGPPMNDALLGGRLDVASGGLPVFLVLWDRGRGRLDVRALAALNAAPIYLNTNRENVRTIRDFGPNERIALPAVRSSTNAIVLQMAAEAAFGAGQHERLDALTVSMPNPEGHAALLARRTEIAAHMVAPPFCFDQLRETGIRRVLSSYDVMGGKGTINAVWALAELRRARPEAAQAVRLALNEANAAIAADPAAAARIYREVESVSTPAEVLAAQIAHPEIAYDTRPNGTLRFAEFMHRTGTLRERPADASAIYVAETAAGAS